MKYYNVYMFIFMICGLLVWPIIWCYDSFLFFTLRCVFHFSSYGRPSRTVCVEATFVPFNPSILPSDDEWTLLGRPFFHTYWTDCVSSLVMILLIMHIYNAKFKIQMHQLMVLKIDSQKIRSIPECLLKRSPNVSLFVVVG